MNSINGKNRRIKKRILWSDVNKRIGDFQFRIMFRMTRPCFNRLCQHIIAYTGEKAFKSEAYINAFLKDKCPKYEGLSKTNGGYISGEVKLAVTLRFLAGGDALDLGVIFDIYPDNCNKIMYDVLLKWIIPSDIGMMNMIKYVGDDEAMDKVSNGFSKRSNGVLKGAIGALDCWLVRIVKPS